MGGIPEVGSPCGLTYLLSSSFSALALPCTSSHVRSSLRGSSRSMTRNTALLLKSASYDTKDLPANVDWRDEGMISGVKNQGQCGSCWAFGTTEQIESYAAIASGNLVELSTQQVTSCAPNT